jgi:small conductance mechanosensitive channel
VLSGATSALVADQGWLYDVLRWAGVSSPTAAHWQQVVIKPVTVVVVVLVAVLIGWLGNRAIRRWVGAVARKAVARADSPRAAARATTLTALLANVWRGVVGAIAFFVALGTIGVNLTPLLAGATVIGATLGFGAQSMVRDLLSGFLLTVEGQFDIGDTVMVGDTSGTVEDLTLRVTRLRSYDGTVWFVPNGEIRKLANASRGWALAAVDIAVPAAADVDSVLAAVRAGAEAVTGDPRYSPFCLEAPRVWGVVGSAADTLTTRVSVRAPTTERDMVARALREEVVRRLHAAGAFGSVDGPVATGAGSGNGDGAPGGTPDD